MILPLSPVHIRAVSEAHVHLDSSAFLHDIREIGVAFREEIFYPTVLEDPDSFVWLYETHGQIAGYVVGTKNSSKFYDNLKRSQLLTLLWLVTQTCLKKPGLLVKYAKAAFWQTTNSYDKNHSEAEILALGVFPQFRSLEFEKKEGVSIAESLFRKALESFRKRGVCRMRVLTTQDNVAANRFYNKQGCKLAGKVSPMGSVCNVYLKEFPVVGEV